MAAVAALDGDARSDYRGHGTTRSPSLGAFNDYRNRRGSVGHYEERSEGLYPRTRQETPPPSSQRRVTPQGQKRTLITPTPSPMQPDRKRMGQDLGAAQAPGKRPRLEATSPQPVVPMAPPPQPAPPISRVSPQTTSRAAAYMGYGQFKSTFSGFGNDRPPSITPPPINRPYAARPEAQAATPGRPDAHPPAPVFKSGLFAPSYAQLNLAGTERPLRSSQDEKAWVPVNKGWHRVTPDRPPPPPPVDPYGGLGGSRPGGALPFQESEVRPQRYEPKRPVRTLTPSFAKLQNLQQEEARKKEQEKKNDAKDLKNARKDGRHGLQRSEEK
ncbi:hypothetical protein BJ508DRAFT_316433, partial [Ascobolus immersus RN42]